MIPGPFGGIDKQIGEKMKKSFFAVALACMVSFGGLTAYADNFTPQGKVSFDNETGVLSSKGSESLSILLMNPSASGDIGLSSFLTTMATTSSGEKEFGYLWNDGSSSKFVSLANVLKSIDADSVDESKVASISLGKFEKNNTIQFGYADKNGENFSSVKIESEAGFHGPDADSFFHLDFSEDPFDGRIEVIVVGQPLPASTVTLLVALAAGAGLLLLRNRKQHARRISQV